jgi:prepilin signal peptidase PulO-like enzyme (type II secretory pathway)
MSTVGYGPADGPGGHRVDRDVGDVGNASVGDLVSTLTTDLSRLMRAEFALAKAETVQEATRAGRGAGLLAGAGAGVHLVLIFGSLAVMFGLGYWLPLGWAALIVAVVWAIAAAALASTGRKALRTVNPTLPETTESLKEDARWAKRPRG